MISHGQSSVSPWSHLLLAKSYSTLAGTMNSFIIGTASGSSWASLLVPWLLRKSFPCLLVLADTNSAHFSLCVAQVRQQPTAISDSILTHRLGNSLDMLIPSSTVSVDSSPSPTAATTLSVLFSISPHHLITATEPTRYVPLSYRNF
jgi:hypothetical protein